MTRRSNRWALVFAVAAACGNSPEMATDGGAADSAGDGAPGDTATDGSIDVPGDGPWVLGTVRVWIGGRQSGLGAANKPVVYSNPDGTTAALVMTAADGWAQADVPNGGSVTAVFYNGPNSAATMLTVLDVKGGDQIRIPLGGIDYVTSVGTFTVNFPPYPNATEYLVQNPCEPTSTTTTSAVISIASGCVGNPIDLRVIALRSGTEEVAYLEKTGVPYVNGGSATLTGTWQLTRKIDTTLTNSSAVSVARKSGPNLSHYSTDVGFRLSHQGSTVFATFAAPPGRAQYFVQVGSGMQYLGLTEVTDGTETTYVRDWNAIGLPPLLVAPTFDIATRTTTTNVTAQADIMQLGVGYSHPNQPSRSWTFLGPVSPTVTLPEIPAMYPVMPQPGDSGGAYAIGVYDSTRFNGYDEARQYPLDVYSPWQGPIPPVGTVTRGSQYGLFVSVP